MSGGSGATDEDVSTHSVRGTGVEVLRPGQPARRARDRVAVEEPLELRVETRPIGVVMRTPGHDVEWAAGFLLSEGVIRGSADLRLVRHHPRSRVGNVLEVYLTAAVAPDLAALTRHTVTSSSCGLCGTTCIRDLRRRFPRVDGRFSVAAMALLGMPEALMRGQSGFAATGGLHAAGLFDPDGTVRCVREDVGRHNAVDKVIGRSLLDGRVPLRETVLVVSGRVSFEIVQKALAAGIAFVAAVGAPSSLAVSFARANGQTLVGFLRGDRFNVYAGRARVKHVQRRATRPRGEGGMDARVSPAP